MKTLLDREDLVFNPPQLGCVLYLSGLPGGGNKIHDRSPYGNQGSITGATWKRLPSGLWCLSFDGNDGFVNFGDLDIFSFTDGAGADLAFSLEVWVNLTDATANVLLAKYDSSVNKREWYLTTGGDDSLSVWCGHLDENVYITRYTAGGYMTTYEGEWIKVVATYDGLEVNTGLLLYINGAVITANAGGAGSYTGMSNTNIPMYIGVSQHETYGFLDGDIALPRIHRRVLSALEIQNSFNQEKHLFGVWSFTVA